MGKPKKNAAGFSSGKSPGAKAAQPTRPVDPSAQAGQALVLLQQGRLQEAEAAYRKLINGGVTNEITYGNLAAICNTNVSGSSNLSAHHYILTNFSTATNATLRSNNRIISYFYIMCNLNKVV